MAEVIDFVAAREERQPHLSGKARCAACKHEWVAVAPHGVVQGFECPSCGAEKGFYVYPVRRDEPHWTCDCGNDLFHATEQGMYCPNCGVMQSGF